MNCNRIEPLLSSYLDSELSSRDTWEVEKHLIECLPCARVLNELRHTVDLLSAQPNLEVTPEFGIALQARISALEPARSGVSLLDTVRLLLRPRLVSAWGAAVATCAVVAVLLVPALRNSGPVGINQSVLVPPHVQAAARQNVALSAADPLQDVGSANLFAQASTGPTADSE